jgi:hypothetical protein
LRRRFFPPAESAPEAKAQGLSHVKETITMTALDPESGRFTESSWQLTFVSLQGGTNTTGGRKTPRIPQAMGETTWH